MDIAEPARNRATKKLRALTAAEADEFGTTLPRQLTAAEADPWGGTAQQPLAPSPEDQQLREAEERIKRYGEAPPGLGIGPMPDEPLMTARDAEALAQEEFREAFMAKQPLQSLFYPREYDLPFPAEPTEMLPVRPGEAAKAGQLDPRQLTWSLLSDEQRAEARIARAGKVPTVGGFEGLGIPEMAAINPWGVEFSPARATEDVKIDTARALVAGLEVTNKIIEPLEVLAETITELLGGNKPTLFKEGWSAAVEDHRKRSVIEQIALGIIFDPFIVFKVATLSAKAAGIAVRSLRTAGTGPAKLALQKFIPSTIQGKELDDLLNQLVDAARQPGMDTVTFQNRAETLVQGAVDVQRRGRGGPDVAVPRELTGAVTEPAAAAPPPAAAAAAPEPAVVTPRAAAAVTPELPAAAQKIRIKVIEGESRVKIVEKKPLSGPLPENGPPSVPEVGTRRVYHGTTKVFDAFDEGAQSTTALYGPGVYTTEDAAVASTYATGTGPKVRLLPDVGQPAVVPEPEKIGNVWSMDIRVDKFLDIDAVPDTELLDILRSEGHFTDEKVIAAFPELPQYRGGLPEN